MSEFFPLPEMQPVPQDRFEPRVIASLELVAAAVMPDGDIWAVGRDGATYRFPLHGSPALADALLAHCREQETDAAAA